MLSKIDRELIQSRSYWNDHDRLHSDKRVKRIPRVTRVMRVTIEKVERIKIEKIRWFRGWTERLRTGAGSRADDEPTAKDVSEGLRRISLKDTMFMNL